jgi:hypothetical protein
MTNNHEENGANLDKLLLIFRRLFFVLFVLFLLWILLFKIFKINRNGIENENVEVSNKDIEVNNEDIEAENEKLEVKSGLTTNRNKN